MARSTSERGQAPSVAILPVSLITTTSETSVTTALVRLSCISASLVSLIAEMRGRTDAATSRSVLVLVVDRPVKRGRSGGLGVSRCG